MTTMRSLFLALLAVVGTALPAVVSAQDPAAIVAARRAGQVGERYDGYLGMVTAAGSAELRRQVGAVNIRRRALYTDLAARRGVTREEVGITAACSLLKRVTAGEFYLSAQGGWRRLAAGQTAVPGYCV